MGTLEVLRKVVSEVTQSLALRILIVVVPAFPDVLQLARILLHLQSLLHGQRVRILVVVVDGPIGFSNRDYLGLPSVP
jgi:hypothetical protein